MMSSFFFKTLFLVLARLPLVWLHGLGSLLGRITYVSSKQYAARTRENLSQSTLARDDSHYTELLRRTVSEAGKSIVELPWIWGRPIDEVSASIQDCQGWEHAEQAHARGNGIIFLTPHWGCFEVISLYIGQRLPMTSLYRVPKQRWVEEVMIKGRARGLVKLATADMRGVRTLFKALKRGEAIGLLPDQVPSGGEGEWIDFFSRPAYTMTLSGRLAESSNASVLMAYAERLPLGHGYKLNFEPLPLDFTKSVPLQINAALERVIAISPAQYLWSYNRYKVPHGVQPPDNTSGLKC